MSDSYGIINWEYPGIKGVNIPEAEEESGRFTFPDWLKEWVCVKRGVNREDCVFCAFSAQSDSRNTAIRQGALRRRDLKIFLGIREESGWTVYLLDAERMRREGAGSDRFNINDNAGSQGYYKLLLKEQEPIAENVSEREIAQ